MASGILWQLVGFDPASNELYPPVESRITNIFKMFSALGKGSQLVLALWDASCLHKNAAPLPPEGRGNKAVGEQACSIREAHDLGTLAGPSVGRQGGESPGSTTGLG